MCPSCDKRTWATMDATPLVARRYTLLDYCVACKLAGPPRDGGPIPWRRRVRGRIVRWRYRIRVRP